MNLNEILLPSAVKVLHTSTTKKKLFHDIGGLVEQAYGLEADQAVNALIERENLGPTGVGRGIALPHARIKGLDKIVGCFVRLEKSIDFDSVDRQPVDLIFTLFAPEGTGVDHLKALALVSRTLRDSGVCDKLRSNDDASTLFAVLQEGPASVAA